ncbi:putative F420-dependent oxidoreductase family domain protein [Mycobacterium kansasii]|uniref:Putative F420-dependent oxidoreductase family domain protein n=1 Tax=Mycobacterium kansasii TaxID=1768 RepID=A0A1V3WWG8_MYCKA|nr:putative F420-dependent oxidoreductase family domain protein [Mycobacterium kansasii]
MDPFVAMGFAAARTTTLRLIPNIVVLPYRNPFLVAKSGATLDLLSGGRFTLAVGVGYLKREFAALGVDYDERAELFEEALQVIRAVWTSDDISFVGRHFTASGITAHPRPLSPPPIWIGGNTRAARRRVAHYGDGWCPFPPLRGWPGPRVPRPSTRWTGLPTASTTYGASATRPAGTGRQLISRSPTPTGGARRATASTPTPTCPGWKSLQPWVLPGCRWDCPATALLMCWRASSGFGLW